MITNWTVTFHFGEIIMRRSSGGGMRFPIIFRLVVNTLGQLGKALEVNSEYVRLSECMRHTKISLASLRKKNNRCNQYRNFEAIYSGNSSNLLIQGISGMRTGIMIRRRTGKFGHGSWDEKIFLFPNSTQSTKTSEVHHERWTIPLDMWKLQHKISHFGIDLGCFHNSLHNLFIIWNFRSSKLKDHIDIFTWFLFPNSGSGLIYEEPKPEIPEIPWWQRKMKHKWSRDRLEIDY